MKKKQLEILLSQAPAHPDPKPELEQYLTPSPIAADVLFIAYSSGDIAGKRVADLGAGTGIFSAGASVLGAQKVYAIEVDEPTVAKGKAWLETLDMSGKVEVAYITSDVKEFNEKVDTVIQNPPFGSQHKHADRLFIEKACSIANVVYGLHMTNTSEFIIRYASKLGFDAIVVKNYKLTIKHTFSFHTKERKSFDVSLFRMEKKIEQR